jgi:excisionase family DNA binding protein
MASAQTFAAPFSGELDLTNPGSERLFYSQEELASIFGVSVHTIIRDVRLKKIASRKWGRRILVPRSEVLRIYSEGLK